MINRWMTALIVGLFGVVCTAQDAPALKSQKDKLSYALGMDLGQQFRKQSVDVDPALFGKGLSDTLSGGATLLTIGASSRLAEFTAASVDPDSLASMLSSERKTLWILIGLSVANVALAVWRPRLLIKIR